MTSTANAQHIANILALGLCDAANSHIEDPNYRDYIAELALIKNKQDVDNYLGNGDQHITGRKRKSGSKPNKTTKTTQPLEDDATQEKPAGKPVAHWKRIKDKGRKRDSSRRINERGGF